MSLTEIVQNEYWFHVANQVEIPIAGEVDKSIDIKILSKLAKGIPKSETEIEKYLKSEIQKNPNLIDILRTLVGVSDKRMYLELSYEFSKTRLKKDDKVNILGYSIYDLNKKPLSFFKSLVNSKNKPLSEVASQIIVNYLLRKDIFKVLRAISKVDIDELDILVENLILTKEVQQAEAKRRGHGAEFALAKLINSLNVKMIPNERFIRPIGFIDPNVDRINFEIIKKTKSGSWSFDLIVMNQKMEHHAFVQSLIHTSDPGQYGVNKSDETILIKKDLTLHNKENNSKKELWGIVDGVGFCENKKDTIDKMLIEFDCFIQMKSLYKAGLQLHKTGLVKIMGIGFDSDFYSKDEQDCMFQKYCSPEIKNVTYQKANADWTPIAAGKATLFV